MSTNPALSGKLFYPELSYEITGYCYQAHNELGRFAREKQYADLLENKFKNNNIIYKRELIIGDTGNIVDFLVEERILLELKSKPFVTKEDYYQVQRYLHELQLKLGIIINFRSFYLKPKRVLLTDKQNLIRRNSLYSHKNL